MSMEKEGTRESEKAKKPGLDTDEALKCLRCGGKLVESRETLMKARSVWWQKPWGSSLAMDEPVVTYACMGCGAVFFYLRSKSKVIREYRELAETEKKEIDRQP